LQGGFASGDGQSHGGNGQAGQAGQSGVDSAAGGFQAGTGIGAAGPSPQGVVRAASLQVDTSLSLATGSP